MVDGGGEGAAGAEEAAVLSGRRCPTTGATRPTFRHRCAADVLCTRSAADGGQVAHPLHAPGIMMSPTKLASGLLVLAVSVFLTGSAEAQNLDQGKPAPKLFSESCVACHRSPRGLAKGRFRLTLYLFLQKHYVSGSSSAWALASYLESVESAKRGAHRASRRSRRLRRQASHGRPSVRRRRCRRGRPGRYATACSRRCCEISTPRTSFRLLRGYRQGVRAWRGVMTDGGG